MVKVKVLCAVLSDTRYVIWKLNSGKKIRTENIPYKAVD